MVIHGVRSLIEKLLHGNISRVKNSPVAIPNRNHLLKAIFVDDSESKVVLPLKVSHYLHRVKLRVFLAKQTFEDCARSTSGFLTIVYFVNYE